MGEYSVKSKKYLQKLLEIICCNNAICDCCYEKKKITKGDISHSFRESVSRIDSTGSYTDSLRSYRDRTDSENTSRTESVSSSSGMMGDHSHKRTSTPIIDMKPIEFWTANRESVQPKQYRRRLPSETEISVESFQPDLYEAMPEEEPCLTDEEKLSKYQLGQIHFGLHYEATTKQFCVKIIEAKDITLPYSMDESKQDMAHSNPYCKISLLPDQKTAYQTTVQRKTQCPEWNESFEFEISYNELLMRTLEILIKDFDKFSRHCVIGQVHLPLSSVNLLKGGHMWKPLSPCNKERHDLGEILLSLNYLPSAGRLNIDVIKAKQLLPTDYVGGSDPFVRVTLVLFEKPVKTKKTSWKKNTLDPVYNESISFNVTPQQLPSVSLVVTVWDYNSKNRDDTVGRIVLGRYATGPHEITHWQRMMQSQRSPVAQWQSLRRRQDCDQVSPASIAVP